MNPRLSLVIALAAGSAGVLWAAWSGPRTTGNSEPVSQTPALRSEKVAGGGALHLPGAGTLPTGLAAITTGPDGGWHMDLPGPALDLQLDPRGKATVRHAALDRTLTLQTAGVWVDGQPLASGEATLSQGCGEASDHAPGEDACEGRLEVTTGAVTAWFEGESDALKQGWDVAAPSVGGAAELRIQVELDDGIVSVDEGLLNVETLQGDWQGTRIRAWDADRRPLDVIADPADDGFVLVVDTEEAAWPVHVDPSWSADGWEPMGGLYAPQALSMGDVDGDGILDAILGDGYGTYDDGLGNPLSAAGRVVVWLGEEGGFDQEMSQSIFSSTPTAGARFGWALASGGDIDGDGHDDVVVGAPYLTDTLTWQGRIEVYLGSASGLSSTPDVTIDGGAVGGLFGWAVTFVGDVDGDGYDDVAVSAPRDGTGKVQLFLGSATGLSTTPDETWTSNTTALTGSFGNALLGGVDVNGDGEPDLVVGEPRHEVSDTTGTLMNAGRIHVYEGTGSGLPATADATIDGDEEGAWLGWALGRAGDLDGDGHDDVAASRYVERSSWPQWDDALAMEPKLSIYAGSSTGLSLDVTLGTDDQVGSVWSGDAHASFGAAAASPGDMDGDGYGDLVVSAPNLTHQAFGEGRLYLFRGSASGVVDEVEHVWDGMVHHAGLGRLLVAPGDIDGDGHVDVMAADHRGVRWFAGEETFETPDVTGDLLTTSSNHDEYFVDYTWCDGSSLPPCGPDNLYAGRHRSRFGNRVAGIGDVDGDGFDDIAVTAPNEDCGNWEGRFGAVYVHLGSADGVEEDEHVWLCGDGGSDYFGLLVDGGDVNGDGYDDLLVGGHSDSGEEVQLHHGSASGLSSTADTTLTGSSGQGFGWDAVIAGDIDGDGYDDVVVGHPFQDISSSERDAGGFSVFLGSSTGIPTTASATIDGTSAWSRMGTTVRGVGDIDGDGYDDVAVGAPLHKDGSDYVGRVYLYLGGASGLQTPAAWTFDGQVDGPRVGIHIDGGDLDGDGYADLVLGEQPRDNYRGEVEPVDTRALIFWGDAQGPAATPDVTLSPGVWDNGHGVNVVVTDDVDGDGHAELMLGVPGAMGADKPRVVIHAADATGIDATPSWVSETWMTPIWTHVDESRYANSLRNDVQSGSLASAGDIDGDGYGDLIFGLRAAPWPEPRAEYVTRIVYGSASGVLDPAPVSLGDTGSVDVDADADGLPDDWETEVGLDPDQSDATDDPDGDGRSNLTEYLEGTDPLTYEGPVAPTLLIPDADAELTTLTPTLAWQASAHPRGLAQTFQVRIALQPDLSPAVWDEVGLTSSTWTVDPALQEDAALYWAVRAVDAHVASPWSEVRALTINSAEEAPSVPQLAYPVEGDVVVHAGASLQWLASQDPDGDVVTYEVELWDGTSEEPLSWDVASAEGVLVSTAPVGSPAEDARVDWHVRAVDEHGLASDWSELASYVHSVLNSAPTAPSIQWPGPGEQGVEHAPAVHALPGVDPEGESVRHVLQLDASGAFRSDERLELPSNPLDPVGDEVVWDLAGEGIELTDRTDWYLRVQAIDASGMRSPWDMIKVRVGGPDLPPEAPVLVGPTDGARVRLDAPVAFEVKTPLDPDGDTVELQVGVFTEEGLTDLLTEAFVAGDAEFVVADLDLPEGHRELWWSARGVDATGLEGVWAEPQRLKVRGAGSSAGCSTVPGAIGGLGVGLMLIGVRRRRT